MSKVRVVPILFLCVMACAPSWAGSVADSQRVAAPGDSVTGDQPADAGWATISGGGIALSYAPGISLRKLEARLNMRDLPVSSGLRALCTNPSYPVEKRILARLQLLLMRVEDLLEMRPGIPRVAIRVFRSREEMKDEYARVLNIREDHRSLYAHRLRVIYISEQDLLDSLIAREMAQAVIAHYFRIQPPSQSTELLVAYVDEHLEN